MSRAELDNHVGTPRRTYLVIGLALLATAILAAIWAAAAWGLTNRNGYHECFNPSFNRETSGPPAETAIAPGASVFNPAVHYDLVPLRLVCQWPDEGGQFYRTTYVEIATPAVLIALLSLGSSAVLFAAGSRKKAHADV